MKKIPLTQRVFATVDDEDYEELSKWNWSFSGGYAITSIRGKRVKMHRMIMSFPEGIVDHIDGDGLDNRKSNLRIVTSSQNAINSRININNTSGIKGVYNDDTRRRPWRAYINFDSKRKYLGDYATIEEAKEARHNAELLYHGEYSREL